MATQVQFRRGTTAETANFAGALGEVTVDTTKDTVVVHDGSTLGGFPLLREDYSNGSLAPGSLGSPAIKFANSSNTGLYSPSAGTFSLVSSGTAALTSDTAGNLTAGGALTATGGITGARFVPTSIYSPTAGVNAVYLSASNTVSIATNGVGRFTLGPTGDVTITGGLTLGGTFTSTSFGLSGTSSPAAGFNGTYLSAANTVSIATNGAGRFTLSPTGDVTITGGLTLGTTFSSPSFGLSSVTAPAVGFNGMYLAAANTVGFTTNGTQRLSINATGDVTIATGTLTLSAGTATANSFIPTSNTIPTNGMYLPGANTVAFATNSAQRLSINATGDVTVATGSTTANSFIPTSSTIPTNGMYLSAANTVAFATNSTQRVTISSSGVVTVNSTLALRGATSGTTTLSAPAVAGNNTLTLPTGNGNAGQVLTTDGTGVTSWANALTFDTAKASTSGTFVDFTGLPSDVKRIVVILNGVSTTGTGLVQIRLIVGGTPVTSGYLGSGGNSLFTIGFSDFYNTAAAVRHGHMILTQLSSTLWVGSGNIGRSDTGSNVTIAGSVTISGTVTGVRVATNGVDTFDAGNINISYES